MTAVHKTLFVIDNDGVTLANRSREIKLTAVPATTRTILMIGYGGSVTVHAMNIAALKHVEVLVWGPRSEVAFFAPMIDASRKSLSLRPSRRSPTRPRLPLFRERLLRRK